MKDSPRFLFWWSWLLVVTSGVLLFGIAMFAAPELTRQSFGLLLFSSSASIDNFGGPAVAYIALVHGVLGAVMCGWSAALLFVLLGPFRRGSKESWRTLFISLLAWFVPDTVFSLWSGFWQNAVLNAVLAALFAMPLAATHRTFVPFGEREQ
ncbi:MAG: hypothetical protein ABR912_02840 [Terracidiphilus sp.]|jgi:hypothetical protein